MKKPVHKKISKGVIIAGIILAIPGAIFFAWAANPQAPDLISVNSSRKAASGVSGLGDDRSVQVSNNGRYVAFLSQATDLGGQRPGAAAVYVRDRQLGVTELASVNNDGLQENGYLSRFRLSGDGRKVVFYTENASNMEPGTALYLRDLDTRTTVPVQRGNQYFSVSDDGTRVATGVGIWGLATKDYVGGCGANTPEISGDGKKVAFVNSGQILICDTATNESVPVSVSAGGVEANAAASAPSVSEDGNFVAYTSTATNLVAGASGRRVYMRDVAAGKTMLVDVADDETSPADEGVACTPNFPVTVSDDGKKVAFTSCAVLAGTKTLGVDQVYVRDVVAGSMVLASTINGKAQNDSPTSAPWLSGKGEAVGFGSRATNLGSHVPFQVYLKKL